MAEKPEEDPFESHKYPEYQEEESLPTRQEWLHNRLYNEPYENYVSRQKLIESNRVGVKTSFLDGRRTEIKQLKENILREIIRKKFDDKTEVDKSKLGEIFLKPIDNNTYEVYYKNKSIAKYNVEKNLVVGDYHELKLEVFKTKYYEQKEDIKTDIGVKKDLSALKLEVDVEKAKEYEENLNKLQTEIKNLKDEKKYIQKQANEKVKSLQDKLKRARNQNIGGFDNRDQIIRDLEQELDYTRSQSLEAISSRDQRIGNLIDQYNNFSERTTDEIENLKENLNLKSSQIIEAQDQILAISKYTSNLKKEVNENKSENEKVVKELKDANTRLNDEKSILQKLVDDYIKDKEELERKLSLNIDSRLQEVKALVEERDKAIKEKDSSIFLQESLEVSINSLKSSVKTLEIHNDSLKLISEDQKIKLEEAKNEITKKEDLLQRTLNNRDEMINSMKEEMEDMEAENVSIRKSIVEKEKELRELEETYDSEIKDNINEMKRLTTEINSLKAERDELNTRVETLRGERDRLADVFERVTNELVRTNRQLDQAQERFTQLEAQNQNLTTELDSLRSNYRNLIAASETTNNNNTQEILRLNNIIKQLESKEDSVQTFVNGLVESIDTYKGLLDEANKTKKESQSKFKEECDKLNKEKENLVKELSKDGRNENDLRKKLIENENRYSLLYKKYEKVNQDLESIVVEREKILKREEILKEQLRLKDYLVGLKEITIGEKYEEIEKLKKQIEDANLNIRNSDFFKQQFEQKKKELEEKTKEYNELVQLLNRKDMDKNELEEEIRILQQEIADVRAEKERAQSKILPPETIEQMKHDIKNLNKLLDEKEKESKEDRKKIRNLEGDKKNATDNFNRLRETTTKRMERMKEHHEREIKKLKEKYIKTVGPQEIKAAAILLENLGDIENYDNVNYDEAIKKLRDAREKFRKLIEDPNTPRNKKFLYKEIDEILQYRVDFLNVEFDKPVETSKGNEILVTSERGRFLFLRRLLLWVKNNPTSVISIVMGTLSTVVTSLVYYVSLSGIRVKKEIVEKTKTVAKYIKEYSPTIASATITLAYHLIGCVSFFVKYIYEIIIGAIIATITLRKMYGEEISFLLLSIWSIIIAFSIAFLNSIYSYFGWY